MFKKISKILIITSIFLNSQFCYDVDYVDNIMTEHHQYVPSLANEIYIYLHTNNIPLIANERINFTSKMKVFLIQTPSFQAVFPYTICRNHDEILQKIIARCLNIQLSDTSTLSIETLLKYRNDIIRQITRIIKTIQLEEKNCCCIIL